MRLIISTGTLKRTVPAKVVTEIIIDLMDEIQERTGDRPTMPVAFAAFRC